MRTRKNGGQAAINNITPVKRVAENAEIVSHAKNVFITSPNILRAREQDLARR
jgi:hypothetical protein